MNLFKKSYIALAIVLGALSSFAQFASSSAPVVPGEYTDPTNLRRAIKEEAPYETPKDFQFPYISLYYLKPIVTTKDKIEVDYYVTDWDHSLERMRDKSHRFDIHFKCVTSDGKEYTRVKKNVGAGDGKFTFKPFKQKGEYNICLWAVDIRKGLCHSGVIGHRQLAALRHIGCRTDDTAQKQQASHDHRKMYFYDALHSIITPNGLQTLPMFCLEHTILTI